MTPPPPLEWHPFYRDQTWLLDWVQSEDRQMVIVPIPPVVRVLLDEAEACHGDPAHRFPVLIKRKAAGAAPWTGSPFFYVWYVATDQYGRSISSESWAEPEGGNLT